MRAVNQEATKVINRIITMMNGKNHIKLDNASGAYMPLVVEKIHSITIGPIKGDLFSFAHYGRQNGDAMRDPDVVMLRGADGRFYPESFQNDYLGLYQSVFVYDDTGRVKAFRKQLQTSIAVFVGDWMKNIVAQQGI